MTKSKVTISLDESLLKIIDDKRGKVKRSTHINDILEQYYGVGEYAKKASKEVKAKKQKKEGKKRKD